MRYALPEGILFQELPGEAVLLNLATAEYYALNNLGAAVIALVRSGADRAEIEAALVREYDAPAAQIQSDLTAFLRQMLEFRLLTEHPE